MNRVSPSYEAAMSAPIQRTVYHACTANACNQGRKPCPCPSACEVSENEGPGLAISPEAWIGGAVCLLCWTALAGLLLGWW